MKQSKIVLISIVSLILILSYQNCSGNFESIAISSESEKDSSPERQSAPVDEIKITDTVLELQSVENITFESAEIIVQLNNASQAYIEYGTSDKYGEETLLKDKYLLTHIQKLNGLSPNTKYNYRIHFTDEEGREFISQNFIFKTEQKSENISDNIDKKPLMEDSSNPPQGTCFNPWDDNGMHLQKRVKRLMLSPYRSGFGEKTIGGTKNLVVVTNPAITGGGSYRDIITKAKPGDYIVFDPRNNVYQNGCERSECAVPGSVTIDGSLSNGKYVTLQKRDMSKNYPSLTFSGGNNILTNIFIDHANLASAVAIGNGENYWFHQFRIHNPNDDNLTIGNPRSNVTSSADSITISRYQVLPGASKGVLLNSGGASCKGDSGRTGSDVGLNQRRLRVTILSSELRAGTRNILNKGGYAEIINTYINGRVENSITRLGGQTLIRCSYVDSQTVRSKGIGVDEGFYESGGTSVSPSFCPQQSEVFLADNLYIQENYPEPSKQPRINLSSSSIKAGKNGYITNNLENWLKPTGGRPAFERNYSSNVSLFCANDNPVKSVGAGPNFKLDPVCE